ncbi:MAG: Ig-like domain repeat protein [Acidobacteriota bacterium]
MRATLAALLLSAGLVYADPTTIFPNASPNPAVYGQAVLLTATVIGDFPSGTVTFSIPGHGPVVATLDGCIGMVTAMVSDLPTGSYTIVANYSGDVNNDPATNSFTMNVAQGSTTTGVLPAPNPASFGQAVTFNAAVTAVPPATGTPTGSVTFIYEVGGVQSVPLVGGVASLTVSTQPVGMNPVMAIYSGDTNFSTSGGNTNSFVNQAATTTTTTSSPNPSVFGQTATLTASIAAVAPGAGTPNGTVSFFDGATLLGTGSAVGGVATLTTSSLSVGTHSITSVYNGSLNFSGSISPVHTKTVTQASTSTSLGSAPDPSVLGQTVILTATLTAPPPGAGTPTGTVSYFDGASLLGTAALSGGAATLTTSSLTQGTHSLTAVYSGDANFTGSTSPLHTHTVNQAASTTTLAPSPNPSVFGQSVFLIATASPVAPAVGIPTGTASFFDGATLIGTSSFIAGTAVLTTSTLSTGTHSLTIVYSGDSSFTGSTSPVATQTVTQASTITILTSAPTPSTFGQSATLTATVVSVPPGSGTPTGTVSFFDGATLLGTGTLSAGVATLTTTALPVGSRSLSAVYGADANFNASTGATTHVVTQGTTTTTVTPTPNPSVTGQSVTFTATVAGTGTPTGTVTFVIASGPTLIGTLNGSGQATVTTSALEAGSHVVGATYSGDSNYASSIGSVTQTVNPAATTTTLTSTPSSSAPSQTVTLTAAIAVTAPGAGTPTGTVSFFDGSTLIMTSPVSAGSASITTSSLTTGPHTLSAIYAGDANFSGSTGTASHSVGQSTTSTALVLLTTGEIFTGQSYTIKATVTATSGTPTGTVTFRDQTSAVIGTATLSDGTATLTKVAATSGTYSITATYDGTASHITSVSPRITFLVGIVDSQILQPVMVSGVAKPGEPVTISATLIPPTIGVLTFLDGDQTLGTGAMDANGTATITKAFNSGTHQITARFDGSSQHSPATSPALALVIGGANVTLSATPNPATAGAEIKLTSKVTPPSTTGAAPTGTVTFLEGATTLGTVALDASGTAVLTLPKGFISGTHTLVARFDGDSNYPAASSVPFTATVTKAASTTSLSLNIATQSLTVSAHVTSASDGTPTGDLQILDVTAGTTLGSGALANGTFTLTVPQPFPVGHTLQASYLGDDSFEASKSPEVTLAMAVNSFSFLLTDIAPNEYISIFGAGFTGPTLAEATREAAAAPTVTFIDSANKEHAASLIYTSDTQLNLVVPGDMPPGPAKINVTTYNGTVITLNVNVGSVSPGIATVDGSLAAAQFVVVPATGAAKAPVLTATYDQAADKWNLVPPVWAARISCT